MSAFKFTDSPYEDIPDELLNNYTLNNKIPILKWWINESNNQNKIIWDDNYIKSYTDRFTPINIQNNNHGKEPYKYASLMLLSAFQKYNIINNNVAVIGSQTPWIEAILLNLNNKVTTIEYNVPQIDNSKIIAKSYWDFEKNDTKYDTIVTYSSIEHSGLGRYGDPLDPSGDIKTMKTIHKKLNNNGFLIWGAPVGRDALVWNAHRVYGRIRLPLMFDNFRELEWFGYNKKQLLNLPLRNNGCQPVIVLQKI